MVFFKKKKELQQQPLHHSMLQSFHNVRYDISHIFHWLNHLHNKTQYQESLIQQLRSELAVLPKSKEEIKKIIDDHYAYNRIHRKIDELKARLEEYAAKHKHIPQTVEKLEEDIKDLPTKKDIEKIDILREKIEEHRAKHRHIPHEIERLRKILDDVPTKRELDFIHTQLAPKKTTHKVEHIKTVEPKLTPKEPESEAFEKLTEISQRLQGLEDQKKVNMRERIVQRITKNSKDYVKNVILSLIRRYQKMPALKIKEMIVDEQLLCSKSSFYRLLQELEESDEIDVIWKGKEKIYISKITKTQ